MSDRELRERDIRERDIRERDIRERDILVASNEFAYVQDLTKGDIVLYVGPTKISLSNTERLVELKNERFVPVRTDDASLGVHPFVTASSSQYIVVENPAKDPTVRPLKGNNANVELLVGRKIVVPGPATFPLWPGQKAKVVSGHELREDEYLIVRVYDAVEGGPRPIGTESVVRGSDTSFYIPRTGLEVVPWEGGYVRKARRLRKSMGLHLRVVRAFVAEEGDQLPPGAYRAGQDIFLKDREGFFFPTEQLEIIGTTTSASSAITCARSCAQPRARTESRSSTARRRTSCVRRSSAINAPINGGKGASSKRTACGSTTSRSSTCASSTSP